MFKWVCLAVAVLFLLIAGWMLNDIRLQVHRSVNLITTTGEAVQENLPPIVERSRQTAEIINKNLPRVVDRVNVVTQTVAESLPEMVQRVDRTTEVLAELSEDIRQLKELAGATGKRDENIVTYATGLLQAIEKSGGTVGVKKVVGSGLKNTLPAAEWVAGARKEALFLTVVVRSKKEMLTRLGKTKLGLSWYIEIPGKPPVPLIDWLKQNHEETRQLF